MTTIGAITHLKATTKPFDASSADSSQSAISHALWRLANQFLKGNRALVSSVGVVLSHSEQVKAYQAECERIHDYCIPLSKALGRSVQARMSSSKAIQLHFNLTGIKTPVCRGTTHVWACLHHANPQVEASWRMAVLMSKLGVSHSVVAQRLYKVVTRSLRAQQAQRMMLSVPEKLKAINTSSRLYGIKIRECLSEGYLLKCGPKSIHAIAKRVQEESGYYDLVIQIEGFKQTHCVGLVSQGKGKPFTLFDQNLGESSVPPAQLDRFIRKDLSRFYESFGVKLQGVKSVNKMTFFKEIKHTPLAGLFQEP